MSRQITVTTHFSAAHFYAQPAWSEERNRRTFGRCYTKHGHGHDYRVEATFTAEEQPPQDLHARLHRVTDALDHRHLNFDVPEFREQIPTTENIALFLARRIRETGDAELLHLRLFETPDLWVEVTP